jgi:hypothetical protein
MRPREKDGLRRRRRPGRGGARRLPQGSRQTRATRGTAGVRRRRARQLDPVWGPLLEGLRVLEREYPLGFTQACRSVGFYLVGLDTRLQRELFRLKPDPGTIAVEGP